MANLLYFRALVGVTVVLLVAASIRTLDMSHKLFTSWPWVRFGSTQDLPTPPIVSLHPEALSASQGQTLYNVFALDPTGFTSYSLIGYPTSQGSSIYVNPYSGVVDSGSKQVLFHLTVAPATPKGKYAGSQLVRFEPGGVQQQIPFTVNVSDTPVVSQGDLRITGFTLSTDFIIISIPRGGSAPVLQFTSKGSTGFRFSEYPTSYGKGIEWYHPSGGISNGQTIEQKITVSPDVPLGIHTGTGVFTDITTGKEVSFPVTVKVTN